VADTEEGRATEKCLDLEKRHLQVQKTRLQAKVAKERGNMGKANSRKKEDPQKRPIAEASGFRKSGQGRKKGEQFGVENHPKEPIKAQG